SAAVEDLGELGEGVAERFPQRAEAIAEEVGEDRRRVCGGDDLRAKTMENLEGKLRRLFDAVPVQDARVSRLGLGRELPEEPGLAAPRGRLEKYEPAATLARVRELLLEDGQLFVASDERGLGEGGAAIAEPDHHRGIRVAPVHGRGDLL